VRFAFLPCSTFFCLSGEISRRSANADAVVWAPCSTFLKQPGNPNIPIQAIGLSLYEQLGTSSVEEIGTKVTRTQWLDLSSLEMENLIGKNVLIVDEVDDTRTTLEYAVKELEKDVQAVSRRLGRESEETKLSVFVLHVSLSMHVHIV
jgi:hypoxanthine phosphoribosyltransferase